MLPKVKKDKRKMIDNVMVSVIVLINKNTKRLDKCLSSLLQQTNRDFEIYILGNLNDNTKKVLNDWMEMDQRIIVPTLENKDSVAEYLVEVILKTSTYCTFINGDDFISIDYIRLMKRKACIEHADIIISGLMKHREDETIYYYNLDPIRLQHFSLQGNLILDTYNKFAPSCSSWKCLNNKLLRNENVIRALKSFEEDFGYHEDNSDENLLDILETLFMASIFENADSCVNVCHAEYFQSEKPHLSSYEKCKKILTVLVFYSKKNICFRNNLLYSYLKKIKHFNVGYYDASLEYVRQNFPNENIEICVDSIDISYFESIQTVLDPCFESFENLKKTIANAKTEYVSFDIFDTLILRNTLEPIDVFRFLNKEFNELIASANYIDFGKMRYISEDLCRKKVFIKNPSFEEITLDEIYEEIKIDFSFSDSVLELMKEKEKELEYKLCKERKTGKELYELALDCGKKVICISDMYLPLSLVQDIMIKNGYTNLQHIFLSSELRLGKYTCSLFKYVKNKLKIKNNMQIIHIGDNWITDVENGKKAGLLTFHLSKPLDLYKGINPGIHMGKSFEKIFQPNGSSVDGRCGFDLYSGLRAMVALTVNKFYDCPYYNFNHETYFNANPCLIGYYCVGMHLLSLIRWLYQDIKSSHYNKIHFLARDGYLPIEAYKIYTIHKEDAPMASYTPMSRYIIPLCDIIKREDVYNLLDKMNVLTSTPQKIVYIFNKVITNGKLEKIKEICKSNGIIYEKELTTYDAAYKMLDLLAIFSLLQKEREHLQKYFQSVFKENECLFDIGYNGRVENALASICGYSIDSYYVHTYKELALDRAKTTGFRIHTFYDFQPVSTFLVREQCFSKLGPSVSGIYFDSNGNETLTYEEEQLDFEATYATSLLQKAALDFVKDFTDIFGGLEEELNWRDFDASLPFEFWVSKSQYQDRMFFSKVLFNDKFGENIFFNLADYWQANLDNFHMFAESRSINYIPTTASFISETKPSSSDITQELSLLQVQTISDAENNPIYADGLFMDLYRKINKLLPLYSKRREFVKKIFGKRG